MKTIRAVTFIFAAVLATGCEVYLGDPTGGETPPSCTSWNLKETHYQAVSGCAVPSGTLENYLVGFQQDNDILEIELLSNSTAPVPALDFVRYKQYVGFDERYLDCALVEFPNDQHRVYECYLRDDLLDDVSYEIESIQFRDPHVGCGGAVIRFSAEPDVMCPLTKNEIGNYSVYYRGEKIPFLYPRN